MPPTGNGQSIAERARTGAAVDAQDGLFDKEWDDSALIGALEERERIKEQRAAVNAEYKRADAAAKDKLMDFSLAVGEVARVGRFRIKKTAVGSRAVSFETEPTERLNIGVIPDAE